MMNVRRALVVALCVAAVVSLALLARSWALSAEANGSSSVQTFSGFSSPDSEIAVTNLTIAGGRLDIGYSVKVLVIPREPSSPIQCGLVDTSGRLEFFEASRQDVMPNGWTSLAFDSTYELPELTLGLRCSTQIAGPITVFFSDAEIHVTPAD